MKKLLLSMALLATCGCATINRRVLNNNPITETYQCTGESIAMCTFITVPQIVNPGPFEWQWLNLVTVPIGACCFIVDVPIEAVCDTICYPHDKYCIDIKKKTAEAPAP